MRTKATLEAENLALTKEVDALRLLLAQSALTPKGGVDEILHDLQVHQEELRSQNEELQQAQERIEGISAQNRDLFDYSPVGYFVINEGFAVIDANISGIKMLNKNKARVAGKPFILFVDKKSRKELDSHFLRTKITGRSLTEVWLSPEQRPAFPVILESVKLGNEWGSGWRCLTIALDITERKKAEVAEKSHSFDLERARDRLALIIDCMSQHIAVLDRQGRIAMVNKAWRNFSVANNGPHNFCIGDFYGSVCGGEDASECPTELTPQAILDVINGLSLGISLEYPCHSPTEKRWFRLDISPITGPEPGAVVSHANITARKLTEIQLQESKLAAEAANQAKSDFLSNMSHELRTPLNAVLGFAEVLLAGYDTPLTDKQRGYVDHILAGGSHLLDLINEVLDLAKVEAGAMTQEMTAVHLGSVIDECVSLSTPIFAKYEVAPVNEVAECNATILADPQRTKQLILNLLSNAAKYNRRGGTVTISCETIEDGFHRLIIADTGKGIPDNMQDQMFKPFNRLGADATATEGTGIGLALTKSIIEAMGGRIGFSSVVDEGSRFWLDFPLCDDKVEPPAVATEGGRKLHYCFEERLVLYIEDNVFNMRLMEALFEQLAPMRLITANNAEDGLTLARSSQPDAILLDINLPGINGFEAVARLKHDALIRHIPVVGLSADATSATAERALNSGFVDYLTKPVNLSELIRTLSRVMEAKFVTHE